MAVWLEPAGVWVNGVKIGDAVLASEHVTVAEPVMARETETLKSLCLTE